MGRARLSGYIQAMSQEPIANPARVREVAPRRGVDFDDALPRTETGKLARRTIRERYWAGKGRRI